MADIEIPVGELKAGDIIVRKDETLHTVVDVQDWGGSVVVELADGQKPTLVDTVKVRRS